MTGILLCSYCEGESRGDYHTSPQESISPGSLQQVDAMPHAWYPLYRPFVQMVAGLLSLSMPRAKTYSLLRPSPSPLVYKTDCGSAIWGVQAGCRIAELATALREHGLTLPNYASIREQAIGGFIQARSRCPCTVVNMGPPRPRIHCDYQRHVCALDSGIEHGMRHALARKPSCHMCHATHPFWMRSCLPSRLVLPFFSWIP